MTIDDLIAGALFDYLAYMTTRPKVRKIGAAVCSGSFVDDLAVFLKFRGVQYVDADVKGWQDAKQHFVKLPMVVGTRTNTSS